MDEYGGLLSTITNDDINSYVGRQTMASGFASIANSRVNYSALKTEAANLRIQATDKFIQADEVELQAQEQANALRKQFIGALGNAQYSAAARGVKVTSANLRQNMERSAGELDEDIRKSKKSAKMQANALRLRGMNLATQAKVAKQAGKAQFVSGILGGISDIAMGYNIYSSGAENMGRTKTNSAGTEAFAQSAGLKPNRR